MAERVTTVCDHLVRGNPCPLEPTTYHISTPSETIRVDLCQKHAEPLLSAAALGVPVAAPPGARRRTMVRTPLKGD